MTEEQRARLQLAGGLVSAAVRRDAAGMAFLLDGLPACETGLVVIVLANWYAALLRMFCEVGGIYSDDPEAILREFLLEVGA